MTSDLHLIPRPTRASLDPTECRRIVARMIELGLAHKPQMLSDAEITNLLRAAKVPDETSQTLSHPGAMTPGNQMA